ncbi:AAA domain protein [Pectobacterium phage Nepra]|uniref:AAA domain protein n=1 Tax=Pectobacterium phage Nepra TaxID=2163635 RepID=A0A2S1GT40_9CAUD|nr:AAA domain protein [Pectobacterium phage Nepra]AWD92551.1 AAA domain protein [Pectobacterium phage Nepra]
MSHTNDNLVLLVGKAANGKSASLRDIKNPEGVLYLNCEAGKKLPFRSKFIERVITDPIKHIPQMFTAAESKPEIHTIVVDSLTYLLDMYESKYVLTLANKMEGWSNFAQFFKYLMQDLVAKSTKNVIFTAHVKDDVTDEMVRETSVPVKGSLKNNGIESYFSCVIAAKKKKLTDLEEYKSGLLTITPQEEALGFKYVFQTMITKDTVNERLRGPMGLFAANETFIDNDLQLVLDRLHEYYGDATT